MAAPSGLVQRYVAELDLAASGYAGREVMSAPWARPLRRSVHSLHFGPADDLILERPGES